MNTTTHPQFKIKDRSAKLQARKGQMKVNGRGLKSVILPVLAKKAS